MSGRARFVRVGGSAYAIGYALGQRAQGRLNSQIGRYIAEGPARFTTIDLDRLARGAMPWFDGLPKRYRDEMLGLSDGSGVPLQRIAEWTYVEACSDPGCSGFLVRSPETGKTWVGRNNDLWAPDVWGHAIVRDSVDRIPTLVFGMAAETFTATGINRARLWLHYQYLPPSVSLNEAGWFEFVWLTDALETCESLTDLAVRLDECPRRASMLLFAVDGKTGERAIYECEPASHARWDDVDPWMVGTNHRLKEPHPESGSMARLHRLEGRLIDTAGRGTIEADSLIDILSDGRVEQHREGYGTVYSTVVCPSSGEIHFTYGGFPAASQGDWAKVDWPWPE